ncbi:tumor necrosis factor receptor superfamily member 3 [Coregonus clupeaformis]|uniref:tumor necrosis factor receptor superfamily member 3 n=1 Tax=Coregonus clupeaformis TaxID=59861 RepID=UPI001BE05E4F|nr:tumor necrosis factor receptor superfamily member 3 [Coregonus clupeaformis]
MAVEQFFAAALMLSAHLAFSYPLTTETYYMDAGRQCRLCPPGHYQRSCSECSPCRDGSYTTQLNAESSCHSCFKDCKRDLHLVEVEPCTSVSNARCRCEPGFTCTDQDDQTGNCRDCEMIPQLLPPSNVVGIRNNQTGTSSEHSRTSSSAGRCQPPHCDTPGSPVSQAGNATHHTTADTSKHLAAILCPMVVIGILAVIILLCIRRPGDEACFKQALKFCNKGVREASPNKTKEPTYQHHTRQPQPSVKHQTVDPPPLTAANMGPVHVHNAGTVIFSLLNQFTGMGGGTEERGQKERDEEGEGCPAHPTPSPNIHLSQEERNGEMDCVFFPSQEQGKDSHISKEEVLLGEGD